MLAQETLSSSMEEGVNAMPLKVNQYFIKLSKNQLRKCLNMRPIEVLCISTQTVPVVNYSRSIVLEVSQLGEVKISTVHEFREGRVRI